MTSAGLPHVAITGATGFIGRALLSRLDGAARSVTALARPVRGRELLDGPRLKWIAGDIEDREALDALVARADVVIHLAGATKALSRDAFHRVNATATAGLVAAAERAGVGHFILLSSLAATRPDVSDYAASKAAGEVAARQNARAMPITIVRAPAVFGPGDDAAAPLFGMIAKGWLLAPGGRARDGRFSIVDVDDLCGFLVSLVRFGAQQTSVVAPYGHRSLGWQDLARSGAIGAGRPLRQITLPAPAMAFMGQMSTFAARLTGKAQVFSAGKVREIMAGDWIGDTPISPATPLDATIRRCLAPFLALRTGATTSARTPDRSME